MVRLFLIFIAISSVFLLIALPIGMIFFEALREGAARYLAALRSPESLQAIQLTLLVASVAVTLNTLFGISASWAIAKFTFPGKQLLMTLIELPLSISPVISGFVYVLLFSPNSPIGSWLIERDIHIIFAVPGVILATLFVTFPFVARQLIPLMQQQGTEQEEAAILLGASGLQVFLQVTLPNIKWGLLYGVLLCNARAMGEFGAVSVVSGHIEGKTNTVPLHVELMYNEYNFVAAFTMSSLLTLLALLTLILKSLFERKFSEEKNRGKT